MSVHVSLKNIYNSLHLIFDMKYRYLKLYFYTKYSRSIHKTFINNKVNEKHSNLKHN